MFPLDEVGPRSWCAPERVGWNRLPARSPLYAWPERDAALEGAREASPWWHSLDGAWRFRLFDRPEAVPASASAADLDDGDWDPITVPGHWTLQGWDRPHYTNVQMPFAELPPRPPEANPTGIHRVRFRLPEAFEGRRSVLHFGGAESVLYVWLNGSPVGLSKGSRLPAEFDVTRWLRPGENQLTAGVVRWSDATFLEDQDHWFMAGLHREVWLRSTDSTWIEDIAVRSDFDPETRDGALALDVRLGAHSGLAEGFRVHAELLDARGRSALRGPLEGAVEQRGNPYGYRGERVGLASAVRRPQPWSAEQPHLYTLLVSLVDSEGTVREVTRQRVGFRRVEVGGRALRVNGRAVLIRGVNRHDHDEHHGKVVAPEAMRADLVAMKRANLNAIRTAHYPNDPRLLDLCDELGLYVVDETDVECHAHLHDLADDPRYLPAFLDRMERMVRRDENHPSVIAWSLGNESGHGAAHGAMAGWTRRYDPSRPLHYEGALEFRLDRPPSRLTTDLICPMYAPVDAIVEWARRGEDDRPLILCEYSHAMGNSNGSLLEYFEAFRSHEGLQGGFVWDWKDQGLRREPGEGVAQGSSPHPAWSYGGDFGDVPNDENFNINGIVWPDGTPKPALFELAKLAQPIRIEAQNLRRGRIRVHNEQDFTDTGWLVGRFELAVDGRVVQRGRLPRLRIEPGAFEDVELAVAAPEVDHGEEAFLRVQLETARALPWAPKGHVVAWEQLSMPIRVRRRAPTAREPVREGVRVEEAPESIDVVAGERRYGFDPRSGVLHGLAHAGEALLAERIAPTFWRAPMDNDARSLQHVKEPGTPRWVDLALDDVQLAEAEVAVRRREGAVRVVSKRRLQVGAPKARVELRETATVLPDGTLEWVAAVRVPRELPDLPRVGIVLALVAGFERLHWLGRGPHECYRDRRSGAPVGRFATTVAELHVPYVMPQANGNRCDVRWLALEREGGPGLLFASAAEPFEFEASHHTQAGLAAARHEDELVARPETWLHLDARQRGVGTGACGPDTLPAYRVGPGVHRLALRLRSYAPEREDPGRLAIRLGIEALAPKPRRR